MMHPKILIAENEPRRAQMYQTSLEADGFQIVQATDCANAWQMLRMQNIAMAIIDTQLPGLHDHNLLLCVRADPSLAKLPVLMIGDALSFEAAIEWLDRGADDYLSRSITSEMLKAQVHAKLRRSQPR